MGQTLIGIMWHLANQSIYDDAEEARRRGLSRDSSLTRDEAEPRAYELNGRRFEDPVLGKTLPVFDREDLHSFRQMARVIAQYVGEENTRNGLQPAMPTDVVERLRAEIAGGGPSARPIRDTRDTGKAEDTPSTEMKPKWDHDNHKLSSSKKRAA
jgi:hypothetical protein